MEVNRLKDERDDNPLVLVWRLGPVARRQGWDGKQAQWIVCCLLAVFIGDLDDPGNTRLPGNAALNIARVHERESHLSRRSIVELATETVDDNTEVPITL